MNDTLTAILIVVIIIVVLNRRFITGGFRVGRINRQKQHLLLEKYFDYYKHLSPADKEEFIKRVNVFTRSKRIIGRQGFVANIEVKTFIAASATQLTFGLKDYLLSRFRTILVYKDKYFNKLTNQYHHGEVNAAGIIVLSWKNFTKGYSTKKDKINLGLHELAHAFFLTVIKTDDHDQGLDAYMKNILSEANDELEKIRNGTIHLFREYAGTNLYEFFAVATEHFFESPGNFKRELPTLYNYFTKLLNQDPARNISRLNNYDL